jgi:hypothetical protein
VVTISGATTRSERALVMEVEAASVTWTVKL